MTKVRDDILRRERDIAERMGWKHLDGSTKNQGWDMEAPDGSKIAIRFDELSLQTDAHFIELEQRADRDSRWKASGFGIARKNAEWWVMANSERLYLCQTKALWKAVKRERDADEKHSRRNLEDSDKRMYSRGQILPLKVLESVATIVTDLQ